MFARAMVSKHHPILVQIVPIRRCNLACTYCNEFDAVSKPVPLPEMLRRVDLLWPASEPPLSPSAAANRC
jgi:MoaA/NifB/PqqE/SkfB family radical SAM enzyme